MVKETVQLKLSHHLHGVVERVNERSGPFVGLLMTSPTEEITLQVSGFFVPSSDFPLLELAGSWKWKNFKSKKGALSELKFGDYNLPIKGENLVAELEFTPVQLYSTGRPMQELLSKMVQPGHSTSGSEVAVVLKRDILPTGKTKSCIRIERFFCAYICR